jgi:hypothetical protein
MRSAHHRDRTANDIEKHRRVTRHVMRKYNIVAQMRHFFVSAYSRSKSRRNVFQGLTESARTPPEHQAGL